MQGHDSYLVLAKGIKRSPSGIPSFFGEKTMAKNLHARLRHLEQRDRTFGCEMPRSAREMTDAQLHRIIARHNNLCHPDDLWVADQVATMTHEQLRRIIPESEGETRDGP
jgi:hypothetical protein